MVIDSLNNSSNPKAIPEAFVRYTITIQNVSSSPFELSTLSDDLNTNLLLDNGLLGDSCVGASSTGSNGVITFTPDSSCAGLDGNPYDTAAPNPDIILITYDDDGAGVNTPISNVYNATSPGITVGSTAPITLTVNFANTLTTALFSNVSADGFIAAGGELTLQYNGIVQ